MAVAATIKGYLDLCRISNLPTVWTNVLCAVILATGSFSWSVYLLPAFALSCHYLAGMCLNDICDVPHDAVQRPKRPIPSGTVSLKESWALTISLFAAGCCLLAACAFKEGLLASLALIAFIIWYDLDHKKNPYSVLVMASCRFLVFAVASLAVCGMLPLAVVVAGAAQFTYVVCISVVARVENSRALPFSFPVIPLMLAGISLVDGFILGLAVNPAYLLFGAAGAALTLAAQRYVRGD